MTFAGGGTISFHRVEKKTKTRRRKTVLSRTKTNHMFNLISFAKPGSLISFPLVCRESVEGGGAGAFCPPCFLKGVFNDDFATCINMILRNEGGTVLRALASHQRGPSSNPGVDAICELRLLLVLFLGSKGFSPGTLVFSSP